MRDVEATSRLAWHCETIDDVRQEIDRVDRELIALIAERLSYIQRAGQLKTCRDQVYDKERVADIVIKVRDEGARNRLEPSFVESLWRELMRLCIAYEFTVFNSRRSSWQTNEN
jgi:isochorismate pyruvate lyase